MNTPIWNQIRLFSEYLKEVSQNTEIFSFQLSFMTMVFNGGIFLLKITGSEIKILIQQVIYYFSGEVFYLLVKSIN